MKRLALTIILAVLPLRALACEGPVAVCDGVSAGSFTLIKDGRPATVYIGADASKPVQRVAVDFAADLERVSGVRPAVVHDLKGVTGDVVVIAEIGHSPLTVDETGLAGQWEAYSQTVVRRPEGGQALVIVGADARGAIYGAYDVSARMGVSPWYWWADVPVVKKSDLYVTAGRRIDAPKVKYRGFFINDEEPSFGGWAREKFGGINHELYGHVFELELRLKGNYLWPAMWGKAFSDDDPLNQQTAADYGIILGTSHHEPMTRAQEEWHRHLDGGVTGGKWDYTSNAANLRTFWRGGIERMQKGGFENIVTVGMRGDGDETMGQGTATQLLEGIVADQRKIIANVTGKPADQTPQVWALYKEVQDYYDHGMKVPDDVTLLFSDDNWGQIRRLPKIGAPKRAGGYGIYYHFDYVGGPRNYKWINTNQIEKTWQQMDLAYESGADRLWIVNVGDIKPMECPLSFFMDMAWNPEAMTPEALKAYPAKWAGQQFGAEHAAEIGDILTRYSQYNARRKPELLDENSFSLFNYVEWPEIGRTWGKLVRRTDAIVPQLDLDQRAAYTELVSYPVLASENLNELYLFTANNHLEARRGLQEANQSARAAGIAFKRDAKYSAVYNGLAGGKWNHMMDQTHIGYDNWQQPVENKMPDLQEVKPVSGSDVVITLQGDPNVYTVSHPPTLTFKQQDWPFQLIYLNDRGMTELGFHVVSAPDWLLFTATPKDSVFVGNSAFYSVIADGYAIAGNSIEGNLVLRAGKDQDITIKIHAQKWDGLQPTPSGYNDALSAYIAIEAEHYSRKVDGQNAHWQVIPDLGRTLSSVISLPQIAAPTTDGSVRLEYDITTMKDADSMLNLYLAPTLDTQGKGGLHIAVSIDDLPPQTLSFDLDPSKPEWNEAVKDNIVILKAPFKGLKAGKHTIKVFRIDGNVVLERLVLDTGGLKPSYLGPPESAAN